MFCSVLENFARFTRNHLCQSLLFIKVAGIRDFSTSLNLAKFLGEPPYGTPRRDCLYSLWCEVVRDVLILILITNFKEC